MLPRVVLAQGIEFREQRFIEAEVETLVGPTQGGPFDRATAQVDLKSEVKLCRKMWQLIKPYNSRFNPV